VAPDPRRADRPWAAAAVAWLLATVVVLPVIAFGVIALAGPHGGILPSFLHPVVLVLGWLLVLGAPAFVARAVWKRRRSRPGRPADR
jgi:hypothetical protein